MGADPAAVYTRAAAPVGRRPFGRSPQVPTRALRFLLHGFPAAPQRSAPQAHSNVQPNDQNRPRLSPIFQRVHRECFFERPQNRPIFPGIHVCKFPSHNSNNSVRAERRVQENHSDSKANGLGQN